jgi:CheY-like chemotaxis protein
MNEKSKIVAIVEDDPPIAQMYRIKLELAGYSVEIAADGESGLAMVKKDKPDLILLDIMMPHMNGDEVLKKLRSDPELSDIPVVILTNIANEELQKKIERLGVAGYIQKSDYTPREVLAVVDELMHHSPENNND